MTCRILVGDCQAMLATLPDESVNCVVTSPPYFGLRDYGVAGQIGLESTLDAYLRGLVGIFSEVRRVLRSDGTCWINIGDSYNAGTSASRKASTSVKHGYWENGGSMGDRRVTDKSSKPKDLMMVPARLALELQANGWWLRSDIIWAKPNPMPESVRDRPTSAHEHVFLLTKSARYWYDHESVRTPWTSGRDDMRAKGVRTGLAYLGQGVQNNSRKTDKQRGHSRRHAGFNDRWDAMSREEQQANGANLRNVWTIATHPFPGSHFATYPPELVERCIKAGCPANGTVLDPFLGSGTTLLVAERLGRDGIGIELNPEYARMAENRIRNDAPMLTTVEVA